MDLFFDILLATAAFLGVIVSGLGVRLAYIKYWKEDEEKIKQPPLLPTSPSPSPQLPISPPTFTLKDDLTRIPNPSVKLVGRESYLNQLNDFFNDPAISIVSLIAPGGVGKSAITDEWLTRLAKVKYKEAEILFGWSFYSQGSHETSTNSTQFYEKALPFFGYEGDLPKSDEEKAKKLAELIQKRKCLLVLDGVEPLQHRPEVQHGWFSDMGLKILLDHIGRNGLPKNGLVLISSRQKLIELDKRYKDKNYREINLEFLSDQEGAELLESLGVEKFQDELTKTSKEYGGHALALVLLGKMLKNQFKGDIRKRDQIPDLFKSDEEGGHALRVMKFYADTWADDKPEQVFLRMLGLFDRPTGEGEKDALLDKASFAKPLKNLSEGKWNNMLTHLKNSGLLLETEKGLDKKTYDTHPLIRDYFGNLFKEEDEKLWKEAHKVLFEYFQALPEKKQPDSLQDLEPLYRAVIHGCLAEEYKKAKEDVYEDRILRGNEYYSVTKLGAFASDLTAMSGFFPKGWKKPVSFGLSEEDQAWLLAQASGWLMSLGRLEEAVGSYRAAIKIVVKKEIWRNASQGAENLVGLLIPSGNLIEAKEAAEEGITWADKSKDMNLQQISYFQLANTEYNLGNLDKALKIYQKAEKINEKFPSESPRLYSYGGALYCFLLLSRAKENKDVEVVLDRGKYGLTISIRNNMLLDIAFDYLTIGRALERLARTEESRTAIDRAVEGMRKAGNVKYFPLAHVTRTNFHRQQGEWEEAKQDLDEAMEVATRCGMRLYVAEGLLLKANLNLDTLSKDGSIEKAREALNKADELIREMKYGLRFSELDLLSARVCYYEEKKTEAKEHFDKAMKRIESTGHYGLTREVVRVKAEIKI
tara:strand:- start:9253 stop:11865 length:2613 start_codon:yes stop_codon:yes gene_type:complete